MNIHSATHSSLSKIEFFRKPENGKCLSNKVTTSFRGMQTADDLSRGITSRECSRPADRPLYGGMTSAYDTFSFLRK